VTITYHYETIDGDLSMVEKELQDDKIVIREINSDEALRNYKLPRPIKPEAKKGLRLFHSNNFRAF
jgi:hypothetical protein